MWALLINAAAFAGGPTSVRVADNTANSDRQEAIVVTGERVARSLKDTPSSVVVIGRQGIEQSGAERVDQLLETVPNVVLGSGGEGPTIRGQDSTGPTRDLPAFLGGIRPRTTLVVDGRPVSYYEFVFGAAPVWDLNRLEVFRSPQTTTQGQNSIAGAIFVHSNDPTFTPQYGARVIVGDYRSRQFSAFASGPLSQEVAVRVAGDYRSSRPASKITSAATGVDPNLDMFALVRFKLLAQPSFIPGSRLELTFVHSASQAPQVEGIRQPFRNRRDPFATYGIFQVNTDSLTGSLRAEPLPGLTVNTIVTGGINRTRRFAPAGLGEARIRNRDWSVESVGNWSVQPALQLVGGMSVRSTKLDQSIDLSLLSGKGRFADRQVAAGLFGEATWNLTDDARLALGLRYQHDSQTRSGSLGTDGSSIALDYRRSFQAWLPKISFSYDISPSFRAGAFVQRAYNPGGTTIRFDTGAPDTFNAESLWDYEFFARASLLGGALTASANLFYYDMHDAQRAQPIRIVAPTGVVVGFADIFNVPRARSRGLEAAFDWKASTRFSARLGIGILGTKISKASEAHLAFAGREFQRSPHFNASAAIEWRLLDQLRIAAQYRYNGAYFSDDLDDPSRRVSRSDKVDVRAGWSIRQFTVSAYARNLFDKFYLTYVFGPPSLATAGDPRELGVGIDARF